MAKKVFVGMSGGVDSTAAAVLLQEQGYEVEGITLVLHEQNKPEDKSCGSSDCEDAARMAALLGIKHHILDFKELFREKVMDYFAETYHKGQTPNPCIACNRHIKFGAMREAALSLGGDCIATGHYACVEEKNGRYYLKKAPSHKDQSYVLYSLSEEVLSQTLFPLAAMTKDEVRAILQRKRLPIFSKPDSQDICFIPDRNYAGFIEEHTGKKVEKGYFTDINGHILGEHKGITHYTVGQRKGLGLSFGTPMYVQKIDSKTNAVVLCEEGGQLSRILTADALHFIHPEEMTYPKRITVKHRYNARPAEGTLTLTENGHGQVEFDELQKAVTPGQAVVFYQGEYVLGGGRIVS